MADFNLSSYIWRGKTYKTLRGLHTAALKVYPHCALSFDADAMVLRFRHPDRTYAMTFARTFDEAHNSVIASEPRE